MADGNSTDNFLEFVGARRLSDVTSIPQQPDYADLASTQPASTQPASTQLTYNTTEVPPAVVPTQPVPRQQGKSYVSLLNEYVQRNSNGSSSTINYTFDERQGFLATVHVLGREFADATYYQRKQEAKESVSRIALHSLQDGVDITPTVITVAQTQPSSVIIERKIGAWLARNSMSPDGRWEENTPDSKRPVSLLNELCQILQLTPNLTVSNDPEKMCVCTLTIGDHVYHSSPSYYPNECKNTVARFAIENIVTNYINGQIISAAPSSDPFNIQVPPPINPLPPPTPSLTNPDGSQKPYVNLLHELCTMRKLGDPIFTYNEAPGKVFMCDVQFGSMFVRGINSFSKKGEAKEYTARLAYETFLNLV